MERIVVTHDMNYNLIVFRDKINPLYKLLAICITCIILGFILSSGHNSVSTSKTCRDIATIITVFNSCPNGTYLEISENSFNVRQYVICRCTQPRQPMIVIEQPKYQEPHLDVVPNTTIDGGEITM